MANIHRLNDDDEVRNRRFNSFGMMNNPQSQIGPINPAIKIPFMSQDMSNNNVGPRDETFWQMLKLNLCPSFKMNSITMTVLLLNTFVFILECVQSQGMMGSSFLEINQTVLKQMGANIPIEIKQHNEYYRLIFSLFLHSNFMHIFFNQVSVMIVMSSIEYSYGSLNTGLIYLLSGIGGNLFADNYSIEYQMFVGCSAANTGLFAAIIAFFIMNWNVLEPLGQLRCYLISIFIFILLFAFISPSSSNISTFSHIGGFLVGLFAAMAIPSPPQQQNYEKYARIFGLILLIMFFFLSILMITATP